MTPSPRESLQFTAVASEVFSLLLEGEQSLYNAMKRTGRSPSTLHGILKAGVAAGLLHFKPDMSEGKQVGTYSVLTDQRVRVAEAVQVSKAAYAARAKAPGVRKPRLNLPRVIAHQQTGGLT